MMELIITMTYQYNPSNLGTFTMVAYRRGNGRNRNSRARPVSCYRVVRGTPSSTTDSSEWMYDTWGIKALTIALSLHQENGDWQYVLWCMYEINIWDPSCLMQDLGKKKGHVSEYPVSESREKQVPHHHLPHHHHLTHHHPLPKAQ